jgi:hypothetical protein
MISNERTSHSGSSSHGDFGDKSAATEDTILTEKIQIERKTFAFALKENPRGRFLRITEDVGGRRDTIIIPAPGLAEFRRILDVMIQQSGDPPAALEDDAN